MRVVLSFPVLQGNGAIKCSRTPAGTPSLHFRQFIEVDFVAQFCCCTVHKGFLYMYSHVYLQSSSKHKFQVTLVGCCTVLLHSTAPQYSRPQTKTHLEWLSVDRLHSCDNATSVFWPNRQMLLCQGLQHTSKKRVTGNQSLAENEESSFYKLLEV